MIIGLAAGAIALAALVTTVVLAIRLHRFRADQRMVLGANGKDDVITHAAQLQREFDRLHSRVEEIAHHVETRLAEVQTQVDKSLTQRAVVRYDAYGELSGQQSTTVALLDCHRNGVILSSITHRDSSRTYIREITNGEGIHELSPEENEAITSAGAPTPLL